MLLEGRTHRRVPGKLERQSNQHHRNRQGIIPRPRVHRFLSTIIPSSAISFVSFYLIAVPELPAGPRSTPELSPPQDISNQSLFRMKTSPAPASIKTTPSASARSNRRPHCLSRLHLGTVVTFQPLRRNRPHAYHPADQQIRPIQSSNETLPEPEVAAAHNLIRNVSLSGSSFRLFWRQRDDQRDHLPSAIPQHLGN